MAVGWPRLSWAAETSLFLLLFGGSLFFFPGWYTFLVGLSALFALHQAANEQLSHRTEGAIPMPTILHDLNITQPGCQVRAYT